MTRVLSPIERMIDAATGYGGPAPDPRPTIILACPTCDESNEVYRHHVDPPAAVRITFPCGRGSCRRQPDDKPHYFDAEGRELDLNTGAPLA